MKTNKSIRNPRLKKAVADFPRSSIHVHESILFGQLMATLKKGDIALAGRGFGSFHAFWNLSQAGVDALMRLNGARKVDFRKDKKLGPNDRLIAWKKPAQPAGALSFSMSLISAPRKKKD